MRVKPRVVGAALTLMAAYLTVLLAIIWATSGPTGIRAFFHWPDGSIWSNLLASALLGAGYLWHQALSHHELLERVDRHHAEQMKAVTDHAAASVLLHEATRQHITAAVKRPDTVQQTIHDAARRQLPKG